MDEVRRKLELIERQLAGRKIHERIISTCPLVFVAVGLILGILIQSRVDVAVSLWFGLLAMLALTAIVFFSIPRFSSASRYVTAYLALCCFVCLGAIRLTSYGRAEPNDVRHLVADERRLATIRGSIITEPYISKYTNWKFARFTPTDPTTSFYINVTEIEAIDGWKKVVGVVRVQVGEQVLDLKVGDAIQAYCWLERFAPATNPGQFDTAEYLARRNVFIAASIQSRSGITILSRIASSTLTRMRTRIKQAATNALLGDISQDESSRGLVEALLLGNRREIDTETYEAFRKTGLLHLISLSGMHLGILFGIVWLGSKTAGFLKPARAVICAVGVAVFMLIVPPRAPTVRAAIIAWVFCASIFFRRRYNPINGLSLAAFILLLIKPTDLFEAGWQLSFASLLGILLFCERLHLFLYEKVTGLRWRGKGPKVPVSFRMSRRPGPYLLRLFSAGLTAWLGGAGVLLYHFYTVTPLASVWTVLVFPLVSAILALGFLKMILFFLLPTLSIVLGVIVVLLSDAFIWIVKLIAHLDISEILIGRVSAAPVIWYYGIVVFAGFVVVRRPLVKRVITVTAVLGIVVYLGALKWQRTYREDLAMTCLDVGHGQAILVRLPGKVNVLFDAGSLYGRDVGSRIVAPYLDYMGIGKIDSIIISHNDVDHINGIPEIVEHCHVEHVYANDAFFNRSDTWGTAQFLRDWLSKRDLDVERLCGEMALAENAGLRFLWPDERIGDDATLSDNDRSLVTLIEFAGVRILLCSDIEQFAQKELLRRHPDLKADIIVVPHHGSATTLDSEFLKKLGGNVLICSCDRSQYDRAKRQADPALGSSRTAKVFYTTANGAITIRLDKKEGIKTGIFIR
ncbi:MAG: DNA internalization-related competence protein ComEC/Rec2 [Planctomycetes bacterium RBG_16_55_9]|nr:MAG: DNA internalization-related competence protein ComEC/Rec2 [Planctomycetes bacterium RBG_16_55_9]